MRWILTILVTIYTNYISRKLWKIIKNNWKKTIICYNILERDKKGWGKMKRNKEEKLEKKHRYDKGQIFVKVMAGFLALLMVIGTVFTIVAALI